MPTQRVVRKQINPSPTAKIVIGSIGVLYGAGMLLKAIIGGMGPATDSAYQTGQVFGLVVAAAVLFFGARYARRGLAERRAEEPPSPAAPKVTAKSVEVVPGSVPPPRP